MLLQTTVFRISVRITYTERPSLDIVESLDCTFLSKEVFSLRSVASHPRPKGTAEAMIRSA